MTEKVRLPSQSFSQQMDSAWDPCYEERVSTVVYIFNDVGRAIPLDMMRVERLIQHGKIHVCCNGVLSSPFAFLSLS